MDNLENVDEIMFNLGIENLRLVYIPDEGGSNTEQAFELIDLSKQDRVLTELSIDDVICLCDHLKKILKTLKIDDLHLFIKAKK